MKIIGALRLVLAVAFAVVAVAPVFSLQDDAGAVSGMPSAADSIFDNVGNIYIIVLGVIALIFFIAAVSLAFKNR